VGAVAVGVAEGTLAEALAALEALAPRPAPPTLLRAVGSDGARGGRLYCGKCRGRVVTEPDLIEDKRVDLVCIRCGARWYGTKHR
jgi:hypothetical protein